jgi:hypothetical protein
MHRV